MSAVFFRRMVYSGEIFTVGLEKYRLPNGRCSTFEIVRHPGGAAVLPVLSDGRLLLIRQFRPSVESMVYEIPAGRLEEGEELSSCAGRELEEETGYRAGRIVPLGGLYSAVGFCNEYIALFLATDLEHLGRQLEPDEIIELFPVTLEQALQKIDAGEIVDGKTQLALFSYQRRISGGQG